MPERSIIEVINLESDELGEFDALAICRGLDVAARDDDDAEGHYESPTENPDSESAE